jgi:hypothetical protein
MTDPFYKQKPDERLGDAPLDSQYYAQIAGALDQLLIARFEGQPEQKGRA